MAEQLGQDYNLYADTTAPTTATSSADYDLVAGVTSITIESERGEVEVANFDSALDRTFLVNSRSRTISGTVHFDPTVDTGQDHIQDAFDSSAGTLYVLLTTATSGSEEYYGSIVVTSTSWSASQDEIITLTFSGRWNTYTRAAVA